MPPSPHPPLNPVSVSHPLCRYTATPPPRFPPKPTAHDHNAPSIKSMNHPSRTLPPDRSRRERENKKKDPQLLNPYMPCHATPCTSSLVLQQNRSANKLALPCLALPCLCVPAHTHSRIENPKHSKQSQPPKLKKIKTRKTNLKIKVTWGV
jgi:hypothetical protein